MNCNRHLVLFCLQLCLCLFCTQRAVGQHTFTLMEWNVENLFDTHHDSLKNDQDFTPDGSYHWTKSRYWRKLDNVAQTIVAAGGENGLPALVGLCEVENDSVLHALVHRSVLRKVGYQYVMTQSPDWRGIDVALLYNPVLFRLHAWHAVRVPSLENGFTPTRDILYVRGNLSTGDTLHVVVCHLPSKAGGGQKARKHRTLAVETLRGVVDSVLTASPEAKLLVMGDYNASFEEKIFRQLCPPLRETLPTSRSALLKAVGTYYFQEQWSYLDHILVSDAFWRWQCEPKAHECRLPFLLDEKGAPHRTYRGPAYNGGISDHLPLLLHINVP